MKLGFETSNFVLIPYIWHDSTKKKELSEKVSLETRPAIPDSISDNLAPS